MSKKRKKYFQQAVKKPCPHVLKCECIVNFLMVFNFVVVEVKLRATSFLEVEWNLLIKIQQIFIFTSIN